MNITYIYDLLVKWIDTTDCMIKNLLNHHHCTLKCSLKYERIVRRPPKWFYFLYLSASKNLFDQIFSDIRHALFWLDYLKRWDKCLQLKIELDQSYIINRICNEHFILCKEFHQKLKWAPKISQSLVYKSLNYWKFRIWEMERRSLFLSPDFSLWKESYCPTFMCVWSCYTYC